MWPVIAARPQADPIKRLFRPAMSLRRGDAGIAERELGIFQGAGAWKQRRELKHEANLPTSHGRARILMQAGRIATAEDVLAPISSLEQAEEAHQCRLAGA